MPKNRVQFEKGLSMPEFLTSYGTEEQCAAMLFAWRWPRGFVCPDCGHAEGYSTIQTRGLLQCRHCRHQTSITAGTVFAYSKLPLTVWFLAMHLLTQQKDGISALELKRQLGVVSSIRTREARPHDIPPESVPPVPLVSVSAFFRNDHPGGIGLTLRQEAFPPGKFEPVLQELFAFWSAMWDEAKANDEIDSLVEDLFAQLNAIGQRPMGERTERALMLALGNIYLLEREGYIRADEYNGVQFVRMEYPGTVH